MLIIEQFLKWIGNCFGLEKSEKVEPDYIELSRESYLKMWYELFGDVDPLVLRGEYTQDDFKRLMQEEETHNYNLFILKVISDFTNGKIEIVREKNWVRFRIGKVIHNLCLDKTIYLRCWFKRVGREVVQYGQGENKLVLNPYIQFLFKEYVDEVLEDENDVNAEMDRTIMEYIGSKQ